MTLGKGLLVLFSLRYTHNLSLNRRLLILVAGETVLFRKMRCWALRFQSEAARVTLYAAYDEGSLTLDERSKGRYDSSNCRR